MTALPESDAATSFVLKFFWSKRRRMASATAVPSMIAPSTMVSGGIGSTANAETLKVFPEGFSSTALTALDPMSRPTTGFDLRNPNTAESSEAEVFLETAIRRKADTRRDRLVQIWPFPTNNGMAQLPSAYRVV